MRNAHKVALGGMMAAVAVVVMALGGMISIATYVTPMLCSVLLFYVTGLCGKRIAWAWYVAVSLLCLLLAPDKEAAAVFVALGYYPIVKPFFDQSPAQWLLKLLLFNGATASLYGILIFVAGMDQLSSEFTELGIVGLIVTLLLGNLCFVLLDRLLLILQRKRGRKTR